MNLMIIGVRLSPADRITNLVRALVCPSVRQFVCTVRAPNLKKYEKTLCERSSGPRV